MMTDRDSAIPSGTTPAEVRFEITVGRKSSASVCATATVPADGPPILQVLLHGGTYNRWYWHPTFEAETFSYVSASARRGLSTLNLDLLGRGTARARPGPSWAWPSRPPPCQIIGQVSDLGLGGRR
jgi:hypothetical protein